MKQFICIALLIQFIALKSLAQDAVVREFQLTASKEIKSLDSNGWKFSGSFNFNINQGSLANWAAGGEQNTLGINSILNYAVNFRKDKKTWDNYIDLAFGFQNATSFGSFRKTDDRIDLTSKYGHRLSKKWYAAGLINFNSQSLRGFIYTDSSRTKLSNFLAPGKLLVSVGFDFRPNSRFSVFVSPLTTRWLIKKDGDFYALEKFGVPAYKKMYNELGSYLTAKYQQPLAKWAIYTTRLDLFSNYKRNPQNVDLFFTNLLAMKFNKWLGSTLSLDMIYDDDVIKKVQIKEIMGLGLTLNL